MARNYRNRRIGDFLKELRLTEGRATGLPAIRTAMATNGSPPSRFEMDDAGTYFLVTLPVHPAFVRRELTARELQILRFCQQPRSRKEVLAELGLGASPANSIRHLVPLVSAGYLAFTIPGSPQSTKQKYVLTAKGAEAI